MCIHLSTLDEQVTGSISQAAEQRAEHRRLYDAIRSAVGTAALRVAERNWTDHIREHRRQAERIRAERAK